MTEGVMADPNIVLMSKILQRWHFMARRYCDMRSSYAPRMFNDDVRLLLDSGFFFDGPLFARDGFGRLYDGLTEAEVQAAEADMPGWDSKEAEEERQRLDAQAAEVERLRQRVAELEASLAQVSGEQPHG